MLFFDEILDFSKLISPYLFSPLTALDIYVPRKWPWSSLFSRTVFDPANDIPDLDGKVILVTGGNAGLGKETAFQLARHSPSKIYLGARSETKAKEAIDDIQEQIKELQDKHRLEYEDVSIEFLKLDLADLQSVKEAVDQILKTESRLDILILNAGLMASPDYETKHGHELHMGTNHIGHFLLTTLLLPLLEKTASDPAGSDVRIVTVSSEAHNMSPPDLVDWLESMDHLGNGTELYRNFTPYARYGASKAANVLFASELARRCGQKGITSVSLHPGLILTDLYTHTRNSTAVFKKGLPLVAGLVFDDIKHGALNQLWCAVGAEREALTNGAYYTPIGIERPNKWTRNAEESRRLWEWTEKKLRCACFL